MKSFTLSLLMVLLVFTSKAQDPVFNWEQTELSSGNNLKVMAVNDSSAFIAGYSNTFLKSTDNGASWDTINLFNPEHNLTDISIIGSTGYISVQREKLYDASPDVYANGYLLKTTDGGNSWDAIDSPVLGPASIPALSPSNELCHGLDFFSVEAINDSVAYCGLRWYQYTSTGNDTHSGIFKTKDGGLTWMNISGDLDGDITTSIEFNGHIGFIGGNDHLFKADAHTDTLVNIYKDEYDFVSDISFVDSSEVLFSTTGDSIWYSNDIGENFAKFSGIKGGSDVLRVNDSTLVVAGSSNKSYASTNNGQSWNAMGIATSIWDIAGIVNDSILLLAKANIYKCAISDLLAGEYNFSPQAVGTSNLQKAHIDESNLIVVGNDKNFIHSSDAGLSWKEKSLPVNPEFLEFLDEVDFDGIAMNGDEGYLSFNRIKFVDYSDKDDIYWSGGILYTNDNWETINDLDMAKFGKENEDDITINPNHDDCNAVTPYIFNFETNDVIVAYVKWYDYVAEKTEHSRVFKSIDGGKNWIAITEDLNSYYVNDIEILGDTMYIGGKWMLLKTTEANLTSGTSIIDFTDLYPNLDEGEDDNMFINDLLAEGNELFLVTSADSCYRSNDGGMTFSTFSNSKGGNAIYRFDRNSFMILGGTGKSKFTNDTTSWLDCHPGATCYAIGGAYNNHLYGLAKGSIYTIDIDDLDLETSIPSIRLEADVQIRYTPQSVNLVSSSKLIEECAVYDLSGKLVSLQAPYKRECKLYHNQFKTGIYIVKARVEGQFFADKIVIK